MNELNTTFSTRIAQETDIKNIIIILTARTSTLLRFILFQLSYNGYYSGVRIAKSLVFGCHAEFL